VTTDRVRRAGRQGRERRERRELAAVLAACLVGGAAALLSASQVWLRLSAPRTAPLPGLSAALTGRELEPLVPALGAVGIAGLVAVLATHRWGRSAVGVLLAAAGLVLVLRSLPHLAAPEAAEARVLLLDQGRATGEPPGASITATVSRWWPVVAALGGCALVAGGLGTAVRSRGWPGMSARYDRPTPAAGVRRPRHGEPADAPDEPGPHVPGPHVPGPHVPGPHVPGPHEPSPDAAWEALDRGEDPTLHQ
jgi:uncharacterized membrane protein (TIGR02234 family)